MLYITPTIRMLWSEWGYLYWLAFVTLLVSNRHDKVKPWNKVGQWLTVITSFAASISSVFKQCIYRAAGTEDILFCCFCHLRFEIYLSCDVDIRSAHIPLPVEWATLANSFGPERVHYDIWKLRMSDYGLELLKITQKHGQMTTTVARSGQLVLSEDNGL